MARASAKSPDAFRTISEAADALDLPQHVLRFWETRFSQIKPMKRSGGRRYYRPSDITLLKGIRHLLYDEGYTIKGVQRILREQGVAHVSSFAQEPLGSAPMEGQPSQSRGELSQSHESSIPDQGVRPDPVRTLLSPPAEAQSERSAGPHVGASAIAGSTAQAVPEAVPPQPPSPPRTMAGLWFAPEPDAPAPNAASTNDQAGQGQARQPDPCPRQDASNLSDTVPTSELGEEPPVNAASAEPTYSSRDQTLPSASASQLLAPQRSLTASQSEALADALQMLMECKTTLDRARDSRKQNAQVDSITADLRSRDR